MMRDQAWLKFDQTSNLEDLGYLLSILILKKIFNLMLSNTYFFFLNHPNRLFFSAFSFFSTSSFTCSSFTCSSFTCSSFTCIVSEIFLLSLGDFSLEE